MRREKLLAPLLLASCSTSTPSEEPTPIHGVTPGHKCVTADTDRFIGEVGSSETGAAILRASKAAVLRWAPPGYMMTMDFREDRVTVHLGPDGKVTQVNCG